MIVLTSMLIMKTTSMGNEMTYKFKVGDRVYWEGNQYISEDYGIVVEYEGNHYIKNEYGVDSVWVKWDSDNDVQYCEEDKLEFSYASVGSVSSEQEAVMLLLSLGYTLSKYTVGCNA